MESHVSKCMQIETSACRTHGKPCIKMHANGELCINGRCVRRRREEQKRKGEGKRKGRERKEREEKKRERGRRKRERKKEKRKSTCSSLAPPVFRRSELVGQRSKVHIFDEGYAPRGRDSSYIGLFISLELFFWLILGPCCAMFMAWDRFVADLRATFGTNLG